MDSIGALAGGIAHDFNNLLTVILTYASLALQRRRSDDEIRADLEQVIRAGERAVELTRQILAFSRPQVPRPAVVDVNLVVASMEKMLRRLLGEDVELSRLASGALGSVHVDPGQIEQIVMNLTVNARDAMPQGGKLTIETKNVDLDAGDEREHQGVPAGRYVMLAVSDTGTGIDTQTRERIFEPFFTTKQKGTGLGLSTVLGIVKQAGGHIAVESEPGNGTTFKVCLPRTDGAAEACSWRPPVLESGRWTETILLVEDDDPVRAAVCSILERSGYRVLEARNGGEALLVCEQHRERIHLLLTDVVLPRMNGTQLARRLTSGRPDMKVLFMSGYTGETIVHHGVLVPGSAHLQKPLTPDKLTRKVREVLGARGNGP